MSYIYAQRSNHDDLALSRAAAERYLILEALSERKFSTARTPSRHQLMSRVRTWLRSWGAAGAPVRSAAGQAEHVLTRG